MLRYITNGSALALFAILQISEVTAEYDEFAAHMSSHGFAWTAYEVTTEDGWELALFRITGRDDSDPVVSTHPPVLLQHGSTMDAESWIGSYFAGVPMPLQLVDAGFDVWMGNNRGTKYSAVRGDDGDTNVDESDPSTEAYWDWSWAEMGTKDIPAFINKIT